MNREGKLRGQISKNLMNGGHVDVEKIINTLEAAVGETNATIPDEVLEAAIYCLNDYVELKIRLSWNVSPESMGQR